MIKKHSFVLFCLFFFWAFFIQAQETEPTAIDFETQTFRHYQAKAWPELITTANQALKEGNDYYYLRFRLGIAYYEQKNYRLAQEHFKKALQFNSTDALSQEYLFYCYLYLDRTEDARKLSNSFSEELKSNLKIDEKLAIDFITFEAGVKSPKKIPYPSSTINYYDDARYFQIGLKHNISSTFSLYHAGSFYNQDTYFGAINQKQYFIQAGIPLKNNWLISPSFHYLALSFTSKVAATGQTNSNYNVKSLQISKAIQKFDLAIGSTFSNISNANQSNHFASITYSAFGNSKLILGFTNYLHTSNKYQSLNNAFSPFVYFEPLPSVGINLSYFTNQKNNLIENNGSLVNNSPDLTTTRYTAMANFRLNKVWSLYALYQLENKIEATNSFNYNYNLLLAGIKINTGL